MKKTIGILLLYMAFQILGMMLAMLFTAGYLVCTGGDFDNLKTLALTPGLFVSFIIIFLYLYFTKQLHTDKTTWSAVSARWLGVSVLVCLTGAVLLEYLMSFLTWLPNLMETSFNMISENRLGVLSLTVVGPIIEELVFRGVITRHLLIRYNPTKAIVLSALVFGIFHLNPSQVISATLMGLAFAWVYYKTGSLIPGIVMHILNNSLSVYLMLTYPDADTLNDLLPHYYIYLLIFAPILIACLYWIWKRPAFDWNTLKRKEGFSGITNE